MRRRYILAVFLLLNICCKKATDDLPEDNSYTNPILETGPDPWVFQKDGFYYYTNTSGNKISLWKAKCVSRLSESVPRDVFIKPDSGAYSNHVWAPEIHFIDGKWYLYFSASETHTPLAQRTHVLENPSPDPFEGKWTYKGKVCDSSADYFSLDATTFEHNSKRYLLWSSVPSANSGKQSIYIAEMANPWTLASKRVLISAPEYDWEKVGSHQDDGVNEGPEILKGPTGRLFLTYSASGCWSDAYSLGMLSLKEGGDPLDSAGWVKTPQSIFKTSEINKAYGPGHNAFFKSPDGKEDWMIFHAHSVPGMPCDEYRNPRIQKFTWNSDGTPDFGEPLPVAKRMLRPS